MKACTFGLLKSYLGEGVSILLRLLLPSIRQRRDYVCCIVSSTPFEDLNIREDWELEISFNEGLSVNYYLRFFNLRITFWTALNLIQTQKNSQRIDDNRSVGIMFVPFFHQHLLAIYLNVREDWELEICFK